MGVAVGVGVAVFVGEAVAVGIGVNVRVGVEVGALTMLKLSEKFPLDVPMKRAESWLPETVIFTKPKVGFELFPIHAAK